MTSRIPPNIFFLCLLLIATCGLFPTHTSAQAMGSTAWFRADTLVVVDADQHVSIWRDAGGGPDATALGAQRPLYSLAAINGKPALVFDGQTTFLTCGKVYPTLSDYTVYAVVEVTTISGANNIVSGNSHAIYLNSSFAPQLLHNGDFNNQAISSESLPNGLGILRVEYRYATSEATIYINNKSGGTAPVPLNTDPVMYIGAYAATNGYCFTGAIAEVLVYDSILTSTDRELTNTYLHSKYGIPMVPTLPKPLMEFSIAPKPYQFYPADANNTSEVIVDGILHSKNAHSITLTLDSNRVQVDQLTIAVDSTDQHLTYRRTIHAGLWMYQATVSVDTGGSNPAVVLDADSIVVGIPIAIEGQSNSIVGNAALPSTPFGRTFGSNYQQVLGDTSYSISVASGNGGGSNVGAWGLHLQRQLAQYHGLPSCIVNGGVGGTTIEQHYPADDNRTRLSTIYGSWLYRLQQSDLTQHIEHLFWYQGESNTGEGYAEKFDLMYRAWHADLPNLKHIYVVQIHPGCGPEPPNTHAWLREQERRFQTTYPDVEVVAAAGLPGHDGCHFALNGYTALGDQLYRLLDRNAYGTEPVSDAGNPNARVAFTTEGQPGVIEVQFDNAVQGLIITPDVQVSAVNHGITDGIMINGESGHVVRAYTVSNRLVVEHNLGDVHVDSIAYVPDTYYPGTTVVYEGPWITNINGMGALTFIVPVQTVSTVQHSNRILSSGSIQNAIDAHTEWYTLTGEFLGTGITVQTSIAHGMYFLRNPITHQIITYVLY